ncbi:MAG: shikimate kinase [Flavobacterium sp.]|nr:shikimate kinase [Flavobacterium sp.]
MKLYLIGMMGSGKSYWAKQLAAATKCKWIDLDTVIEQTAGKTISEIFATQGEAAFRLLEQKVLQQTASYKNVIVATGGGVPCFFDNIDWMNVHGVTVFINEQIEVLVHRLKKGKAHRPLVSNTANNQLHASLTEKLASRLQFYQKAQHTVIGSQVTVEDFIKLINH